MDAADAKIGRCYASILALAVSGACAAAFGPLSGAGAPQGLLIPLALLWGSSAVAVRLLLWCRTAQIIFILFCVAKKLARSAEPPCLPPGPAFTVGGVDSSGIAARYLPPCGAKSAPVIRTEW